MVLKQEQGMSIQRSQARELQPLVIVLMMQDPAQAHTKQSHALLVLCTL